jgi:hypothetical protein
MVTIEEQLAQAERERDEARANRASYTIGETEWAHRIAVAEQRFVDEYDARKAAEREIAELKARIVTLEATR